MRAANHKPIASAPLLNSPFLGRSDLLLFLYVSRFTEPSIAREQSIKTYRKRTKALPRRQDGYAKFSVELMRLSGPKPFPTPAVRAIVTAMHKTAVRSTREQVRK